MTWSNAGVLPNIHAVLLPKKGAGVFRSPPMEVLLARETLEEFVLVPQAPADGAQPVESAAEPA